MLGRIFTAFVLVSLAAPAQAGVPIPTPEAGAGFASLLLVGAGYAWLRKRANRG